MINASKNQCSIILMHPTTVREIRKICYKVNMIE